MEQSWQRHYAEMVVAMLVGMMVLEPVRMAIMDSPGSTALSLVMATEMSVGMTALMCLRGHPTAHTVQMCAAMYASFALFVPLVWLGLISGGGLLAAGHVAMLATMAVLAQRHAGTPHHRAAAFRRPGHLHAIGTGDVEDRAAKSPR